MILRVGKGKAGPSIPLSACRSLRVTGKPESNPKVRFADDTLGKRTNGSPMSALPC